MAEYDRIINALMGFADSARNSGPSAMEAINQMKVLLQRHLKQNNYHYLRTVFFPEFSKGARYPNKFPVVSNTFSIKSSMILPVSDAGVFGSIIKPHVLAPSSVCVYNFHKAKANDWGVGIPFNYNGNYLGKDATENFIQSKDSLIANSPRIYFERSRLIGCSVIINSTVPTNGIWIGGVSYDTPLNDIIPGTSPEERDSQVLTGSFFLSESYALANELQAMSTKMSIQGVPGVVGEWDTVRGLIVTAATANGTFFDAIKQALREVIPEIASDSYFSSITNLFRGSKSTDVFMRDIERVIKGKIPTTSEFLIRALKMTVYKRIGYVNGGVNTGITSFNSTGAAAQTELGGNATLAAVVTGALNELQKVLDETSKKWSIGHSDALAKIMREVSGGFSENITSDSFPGGSVSYHRVKESCQYYHEAKGMDGIRVVYVPNKEPAWNTETDQDVIFIGGQGLAPNSSVQLQIIRHFEGIGTSAVKELFPGRKELPDQKAIDITMNVFTLYPQLIQISPNRVEEYYRTMKSQFKWFDMIIYERGGVMEVERPLSLPNRMLIQSKESEQAAIAN